MKRIFLPIVSMIMLCAGQAFAAHPLVSDDTGTHGSGKYQLEVNAETVFDRQQPAGVATKTTASQLALIVSAGINETMDLVMGVPWQWNRVRENGAITTDTSGIGDATLELKWRLLQTSGFSLAIKPGISLPSGDDARGLGNGRLSGGVTMIATQELAPVTLHLNGGYVHDEFRRDADRMANRHDIWRASLAAVAAIEKNLQLTTEIGLETNADRLVHTPPVFAIGGLIYSLREDLDLDLGVKVGLSSAAPDLGLLAGMSLHF